MNQNLTRQFFRFTIPTILSMVAFSLYTLVDGIFVAKGVGETALAAVNLSSPYNSFMFAVGLLLAVGMSTTIAIRLGNGKHQEASSLFTRNLVTAMAVSVVITVLTLCNLRSVAGFLGAEGDTLGYVMEYVGGVSPFAICFICSYNMEILVKTDGTPILSTIGVSLAGVTNLALDWLFVMVFHWGVRGAAIATGLAQVVSMVLYLFYFAKRSKQLHFVKISLKPSKFAIYRKTLPLGVADSITEMSNGVVLFAFNQTILRLIGESGVVSYTVIGYVNTLVLMVMSGIAQGIQPISSFYYGRQDRKSYETILKMALAMALAFSVGSFLVCQVFGNGIVGLFIKRDSLLFESSVLALRKYAWAFVLMGFNVVLAAFFTSIERPACSFPISVGRGLIFPVAALAVVPAVAGAERLWYAGAVSEVAAAVIAVLFFTGYLRKRG